MKIVKKADILPPAGGLTPGLTQKSRVRREALRTVANIEARSSPPRNDLLPALRMEYRPINELRVPKRKLRRATPSHSADLADSIGDFGLCKLITISDDGEVVDGISTLEKLKELGITEAPCLVVPHLPRRDRRRLRIALNRIQEKGAWDISELHTELAELQIEFEGDLHIPGIEPPELDILLQEELNSASNPLDQIPAKPSDPVSRRGDIWEVGKHVIACGDARDKALVTAILGCRLVKLLLTDPPYNVKVKGNVSGSAHREFPMASGEMSDSEFATFLVTWLRILWDVVADGGLGFCFMDWRGLQILLNAVEKVGFTLLNVIVWAKPNAGPYAVGYKKPPANSQFKKGHSGNPRGKLSGRKNLKTEIVEELSTRVTTTENGKQVRLSKQSIIIKRMISDAAKGDAKARDQLIKLMGEVERAQPLQPNADPIGLAKDAEIFARFKATLIQEIKEKQS